VTPAALPRRLTITAPSAHHETVASYLARLAALNSLDGDELWLRISAPDPTPSRRTVDIRQLAALTGRPAGHLAGALLELRDPPPAWPAFRHNPQVGCPRCDARHPGGPVYRLLPHHRYACTRHHRWIGPPDVNRPGPDTSAFPAITTAQRRHLALVRRHGWAAAYDAVLTGFMICGHLWDKRPDDDEPPVRRLMRIKWDVHALTLIPEGAERTAFTASLLFAAIYPDAVAIAAILASPHWRKLAAGDDQDLSRFAAAIGPRIGDPHYQPSDHADPVAHWIEQDCWRPPSPPPTTFPQAPGHLLDGTPDSYEGGGVAASGMPVRMLRADGGRVFRWRRRRADGAGRAGVAIGGRCRHGEERRMWRGPPRCLFWRSARGEPLG